MIKPYGSATLNPLYLENEADRAALLREAESLPALLLSSGAAAAAVMLASGYFNPLAGYMNLEEAQSVADNMALPGGLMWPTPIPVSYTHLTLPTNREV